MTGPGAFSVRGPGYTVLPVPASPRYLPPHRQLLLLARVARAEGLTFDEFWNRAMPTLVLRSVVACPYCGTEQPATRRTCVKKGDCDRPNWTEKERAAMGTYQVWKPERYPRVKDPNAPPDVVLWPGDTEDRQAAYEGLMESKDAWRSAYDGIEPTPRERAMARLGSAFEKAGGLDGGAALPLGA